MKKACVVAILVALSMSGFSAGFEYSFNADQSYNYNLKYGEEGAYVSCNLRVTCLNDEMEKNSNENSEVQQKWRLVFTYDTFNMNCNTDKHKKMQSRYREIFRTVEKFEYYAVVDKSCNIQLSNINEALNVFKTDMIIAGKKEDCMLFITNSLLPLIAGTWRTVFPRLPELSASRSSDYRDRRDWFAFVDAELIWFMQSAETGCRFNIDHIMQDDAKTINTVIWISVTETEQSLRYKNNTDTVKETMVESFFDHKKGCFVKGALPGLAWVFSLTKTSYLIATACKVIS